MARFFVEPRSWGGEAVLGGDEAKHCARVLRAKVGDRITIFDGAGRGAVAEILSIARDEVRVRPEDVMFEPPSRVELVLAQAVLKGKAMDLVVQKAVELGASVIQPLTTRNAVVQPGEGKDDKWRRAVLEACKQCGRNRLPEVKPIRALESWLAEPSDDERLIASLADGARPLREWIAEMKHPRRIVFLVGPEGDFTAGETEAALAAGFRPASLGPAVLRSETAALFGLAALSCAFG